MNNNSTPTFGNGKICYIELPATDINVSASFYKNVFGWQIRVRDDGSVAFDDTVNQVSGTWRTDRQPIITPGILVHIMVDDIHASIRSIEANGGTIVQAVGQEAPEITTRFADPAGNVLGLYQQ